MGPNKYTDMQKRVYSELSKQWDTNKNGPVGAPIESHNAHDDYRYLFINIPDQKDKDCLDFGCGPGRNLVKYNDAFKSIDGVDLDPYNLECAKKYIIENNLDVNKFKFYLNNGYDISSVPDESYDIIMSTICMQHICVYDIRFSLLTDFFRVLRPNGTLAIQMGFGLPSKNTVDYYANNYNAVSTNRNCDTSIANVKQVEDDLTKIGYKNFWYHLGPPGPGDYHPKWIYFNAIK